MMMGRWVMNGARLAVEAPRYCSCSARGMSPPDSAYSARAVVERQAHTARPHRRVGAQEHPGVEPRVGTVDAHLERWRKRAKGASVADDNDLAVGGLPQIPGVDSRRRRQVLIVGAARQDLA